jgi:hypothetical protein
MVVLTAVCLASAACGDRSDAAREARRVFADASAPGSGTCWPGTAQRTTNEFEMSCELNLATDWAEYKRWLRSKMERQYNTRAETDGTIGFSRGEDGDLYTVNAAFTNNATKAVRITFRAVAW